MASPTTTGKKPHLSPSQLSMLAKCGMQYSFRYIDGIKSPPGVAMIVGTATHKSIEKNLKQRMVLGTFIPKEEAKETAAESFRNTWAGEEPVLTEEEKEHGKDKVKGEAVDTAVSLAELHYDRVAPGIKPIHVEREVNLELKGFPFDLKGYVDIQEPDAIRDSKTTAKSPSSDAADKSEQLTFYSLAAKVIDGKAPATVQLDFLVKTKEPKYVPLVSTRTEADHGTFLRRVERASKVIESGAFMPAPPDSWYCSANWCGYYDRCPFGKRQKIQG